MCQFIILSDMRLLKLPFIITISQDILTSNSQETELATLHWQRKTRNIQNISNANLHHKLVFYIVILYAILLIQASQCGDLKALCISQNSKI